MGKHSGEAPEGPSTRNLARYATVVVVTALAWFVLVYYAIQLGPDAKAGEMRAWALLAVATLGAVACLFLALIFCGKFWDTLRGSPRPAAVPGGRHGRH